MKSSWDERRHYPINSQFANVIKSGAKWKEAGGSRQQESAGEARQTKCGYLLRYKKRLFGEDWREEFVVLYSDSTLNWFRHRQRPQPEGGLQLRAAPQLMAVGRWTSLVPCRPPLPHGGQLSCLMAFGSHHKDKVHWFLCKDDEDVSGWMAAISKTLPPPPNDNCPSRFRPFGPKLSVSTSSVALHSAAYPSHYSSWQQQRPTSLLHLPHLSGGGKSGWGCGWGWSGCQSAFRYSDSDLRLPCSKPAPSGWQQQQQRRLEEKRSCSGCGGGESTALQVAYQQQLLSAQLMDDDLLTDADSFDMGFDCIF